MALLQKIKIMKMWLSSNYKESHMKQMSFIGQVWQRTETVLANLVDQRWDLKGTSLLILNNI